MIHIPTPQEFSYKELLRFLSRNEKECLHTIKEDKVFKVLDIDNELVLFSVAFDTGLRATIHTENPSPAIIEKVRAYIEDWFDLTADLKAFWGGSYREVQKEMKGRYPKHFWPDDPANAQPTKRVKKFM